MNYDLGSLISDNCPSRSAYGTFVVIRSAFKPPMATATVELVSVPHPDTPPLRILSWLYSDLDLSSFNNSLCYDNLAIWILEEEDIVTIF